jgi:hypothetical protein
MDGLNLLARARDAGLRVQADGDKLLIRGPKRAEPVVRLLAEHKPEVLAALAPGASAFKRGDQDDAVPVTDEASRWRDRLAARIVDWFHGDRGWEEARRLAWGDLENEWHELNGQRWPSWQCAGCDAPIGGLQALNLPDGNRVHFEPIDCLIRFGKRWRSAADKALVAFGLVQPDPGGDQL